MTTEKRENANAKRLGELKEAVLEMEAGMQSPDRDAETGETIEPKKSGHVRMTLAELNEYIEAEAEEARSRGDFEKEARLRGEEFDPDFGESALSVVHKVKSSLITVAWAIAPFGTLWLIYQGIRLAIPATRKWPNLGIKYKNELETETANKRVVRLSASR